MHYASTTPHAHRLYYVMATTIAMLLALAVGIGISLGNSPTTQREDSPAGPYTAHRNASEQSATLAAWPQLQLGDPITGFDLPVYATHAGDGSERLFVVEQRGSISIVKNGVVQETPFLDIEERVLCCGERGLLSVAFPPDYASKNHFYVNYTRSGDGTTVIARYSVTGDPDVADPASEEVILTIDQPFSNHNGGQIAFGPDGYLYIGMGDGGSAGDPDNYAQTTSSLLGKMLRLDVETGDPATYTIPADNPFVGQAGYREEIWALGVRNPWRFSFDRQSGDMYIADVGQGNYEEVSFQPATSNGGENYGWRCKEGTHDYIPSDECAARTLTAPVAEYSHDDGNCSVTGGFAYRGSDYPNMHGVYLYGDYCSGLIWGLQQEDDGTWSNTLLLESALGGSLTGFGQDENGELYVTDHLGGAVHQLIDTAPQPTNTPTSTTTGTATGTSTTTTTSTPTNTPTSAVTTTSTATTTSTTPVTNTATSTPSNTPTSTSTSTTTPTTIPTSMPTSTPTQTSTPEPLILPPVDPAAAEGDISIAGSRVVSSLLQLIADEFTDEGYNGQITIDSVGSGAGFERFCIAAETDIATASRAIRDDEREACRDNEREPVEFRVGADAVVVVVNNTNDLIPSVTMEQLVLLFSTAEIWADVNLQLPHQPVLRFIPDIDSHTSSLFTEEVFDQDKEPLLNASSLTMSDDANVLVENIETYPYAIGFIDYATYQQVQGWVRALAINGIEPTVANIEAGNYVLSRPLLMYTTAQIMDDKPQVAAFLNYLLSNVTELAPQAGVLPPTTALLNQSKQTWFASVSPPPPDLMLDDPIGGLDLPVHITNAGDGSGRLFVVEQRGRIRIIQDGVVQETPFLDISGWVSCCSQLGLFSVAFSPDYATTGTFYINYTRAEDDATVVARYQVSDDPNMADPASEELVLTIAQPAVNQNGGSLAFGPDGYLYIGTGDGGVSDDDPDNAQDPASLLGKLLRIDVEGTDTLTYTIPATNPYSTTADYRPEIWALGVRNPWRFSFDTATGDLYLADVGKSAYEEVNRQPAESSGGENYGWRCKEGTHDYDLSGNCQEQQFTPPIYEYAHEGSNCAITGGLVYRGEAYEQLQGTYLYGDYCSGLVWGLQQKGDEWSSTLLVATGFERSLTSFGASEAGEVYVADHVGGVIHRLLVDDEPALESNYLTGAPGSAFTLRGKHFPPNTRLAIVLSRAIQLAQEEVLGTVMTDMMGQFSATLNTEGADPGTYTIGVRDFPDTAVTLTLDADEELRAPEDIGSTAQLRLEVERIFLPLVQR